MTDQPLLRRPLVQAALGALVLALLATGVFAWGRHSRAEAQKKQAAETFGPAVEALAKAAEAPADEKPDLDKTVRILHAADLALQSGKSGRDWLRELATQDLRGVPKEVVAARADLLRVLQKLYAQQTELEDQQAFWDFSSRTVLSVLSLVDVGGLGAMPVSVDRKQAEKMLADLKANEATRARLQQDIGALEGELLGVLERHAAASWKVLDDWDKLTALRDRAYLAARTRDWETVLDSAERAIELSPKEREAHLLKALALVETVKPGLEGGQGAAAALLSSYIEENPGKSAPALLLLGVLQARQGNGPAARLNLEQAAAYYPKQATELDENLNPYRLRTFLRKSSEGRSILERYQSTTLGTGYFSPDLQLARMLFVSGDVEAGRAKVMDHFSRRRAQRQWDAIVSDVAFCNEFLGAWFEQIFPEDAYLDLVVAPTLLGSRLGLKVRNRSEKTLHNATLVLALQFTDMHRDDYETFTPERTQPAVLANDVTTFDDLPIDFELFGRKKTVKDVVSHRAILVSDEAVTWVDTEPFKLAEAEALRQNQQPPEPAKATPEATEWFRVTGLDRATVEQRLRTGAALALDAALGKDDVTFTLPRELAILKPSFRMRYGNREVAATENEIRDGAIRLRFPGIANFEDPELAREKIELQLTSRLLGFALVFAPQHGGGYALESVSAL